MSVRDEIFLAPYVLSFHIISNLKSLVITKVWENQ